MDIVKCQECNREYESHTKYDRNCPSCGSDQSVVVRAVEGREPCPHCEHRYYWRSYTACPNCHLKRDAPAGSVAPGSPQAQQQAAAAYSALPAEERMERILQQILAEQKRATSRLTGIGWGVAILFLWIVAIPFVISLFLSR